MLLLTEGQANDHRGNAIMLPRLPPARRLIANHAYDSARFTALRALPSARTARQNRGITPRPLDPLAQAAHPAQSRACRQRHRIEITFGRPKDWRRIAMRYNRCAYTFCAAIALATTVTLWLRR